LLAFSFRRPVTAVAPPGDRFLPALIPAATLQQIL
jgi:hypothetical protein